MEGNNGTVWTTRDFSLFSTRKGPRYSLIAYANLAGKKFKRFSFIPPIKHARTEIFYIKLRS